MYPADMAHSRKLRGYLTFLTFLADNRTYVAFTAADLPLGFSLLAESASAAQVILDLVLARTTLNHATPTGSQTCVSDIVCWFAGKRLL